MESNHDCCFDVYDHGGIGIILPLGAPRDVLVPVAHPGCNSSLSNQARRPSSSVLSANAASVASALVLSEVLINEYRSDELVRVHPESAYPALIYCLDWRGLPTVQDHGSL